MSSVPTGMCICDKCTADVYAIKSVQECAHNENLKKWIFHEYISIHIGQYIFLVQEGMGSIPANAVHVHIMWSDINIHDRSCYSFFSFLYIPLIISCWTEMCFSKKLMLTQINSHFKNIHSDWSIKMRIMNTKCLSHNIKNERLCQFTWRLPHSLNFAQTSTCPIKCC